MQFVEFLKDVQFTLHMGVNNVWLTMETCRGLRSVCLLPNAPDNLIYNAFAKKCNGEKRIKLELPNPSTFPDGTLRSQTIFRYKLDNTPGDVYLETKIYQWEDIDMFLLTSLSEEHSWCVIPVAEHLNTLHVKPPGYDKFPLPSIELDRVLHKVRYWKQLEIELLQVTLSPDYTYFNFANLFTTPK